MPNLLTLALWGTLFVLALLAIYPVFAAGEAVFCYVDHWTNANSDMHPNAVNWAECRRHLSWPISFFSPSA